MRSRILIFVLALATLMPSRGTAASGDARIVAGGIGDGRKAPNANLYSPSGIIAGPNGSVFIADSRHNRIRTVGINGVIRTVAGRGAPGFDGDGGSARDAHLNFPTGLAVDEAGDIFVADTGNARVRRIAADGTITTVAGGGDDRSDGIPAVAARLNAPVGLGVAGNGTLYIADPNDNRIRAVDPAGVIRTVAGGGNDASDGIAARSARLESPMQIDLDGDGNVVFADRGANKVRMVRTDGTITTLAGAGLSGSPGCLPPNLEDGQEAVRVCLNEPEGVAVDATGTVYIADTKNNMIRRVVAGRSFRVAGGTPGADVGLAPAVSLAGPSMLAVDRNETLLVSENGGVFHDYSEPVGNRVDAIIAGSLVTRFAGTGSCCYSGDGGPAVDAGVDEPWDVAMGPDDTMYIAEHSRVRRVGTDGTISTLAGPGSLLPGGAIASFQSIRGIDVGPDGSVYVVDSDARQVDKIDPVLGTTRVIASLGSVRVDRDGFPAILGDLQHPYGIDVDAKGNVFVSDPWHHNVRRIDARSGDMTTVAGVAQCLGECFGGYNGDEILATAAMLNVPVGIAVAPDGTLYIADTLNERVRAVDPQGVIHTVAGTGEFAYSGDGGPATQAALQPLDVGLDLQGRLLILTFGAVRRVEADGVIGTVVPGSFIDADRDPPRGPFFYSFPSALSVNRHGSLLIPNPGLGHVYEIEGPLP